MIQKNEEPTQANESESRNLYQNVYPNPFCEWEGKAWIRAKPERSGVLDGYPFSPELTPLAGHPLLKASPKDVERVLAYRLLAHLQFTHALELEHVNEAIRFMLNGEGPVRLSGREMQDAIRIYCDEGGHALFVDRLADQVEQRYAVDRQILGRPSFDRTLCKVLKEYEGRLSEAVIRLLFVSISETLVTKVLYNIPRDPRVATLVREVIGDHAADEARHSVFFKWYFVHLWQMLSPAEQEIAGPLLPKFVWAFLGPDTELDQRVLRSLGFDDHAAQRIITETYLPEAVLENVREAASPTLQIFRRAGVMETPAARCALYAARLTP